MSSADWIPASERDRMHNAEYVRLPPGPSIVARWHAHAAEADRRIAEQDALIQELAFALNECLVHGHDPELCEYLAGNAALRRVAEYQTRKEHT